MEEIARYDEKEIKIMGYSHSIEYHWDEHLARENINARYSFEGKMVGRGYLAKPERLNLNYALFPQFLGLICSESCQVSSSFRCLSKLLRNRKIRSSFSNV